MSVINIGGQVRHADFADVLAEVATWEETGESITDNAAYAIAAQFQSPGGTGAPFATLASGAGLNTELVWAIDCELRDFAGDAEAVAMLRALKSWTEDYLMHKGYSPCVGACGEWLRTNAIEPLCSECAE
ncbi:hypothetical protein [Streptomyces sp. NBC_00470]|uniref:hypothetical protein n=1 Tax=Streptomyces sp. NBC_00470 TaxID=2975753 RepID=UPI0030E1819D